MSDYFHPSIPTAVSPAESKALYDLAQGKLVLELGSWLGASTVVLCQSADKVHAVDWFLGDAHAGEDDSKPGYFAHTRECKNLVTHVGRFEQVLPGFRSSMFDFAFLDGYHTYEATVDAARLAMRVVAPGGKIAFHDYGLFGVKPAVDDLFGEPKQLVESLAVVSA